MTEYRITYDTESGYFSFIQSEGGDKRYSQITVEKGYFVDPRLSTAVVASMNTSFIALCTEYEAKRNYKTGGSF